MINYKIFCPSYKRGSLAISHKLFEPSTFSYVIREEEEKYYEHFNTSLIKIPNGLVSNISNTRNWIIDNADTDYIVMVDDDIAAINRMNYRKNEKLGQVKIHAMILNGFQMSEDFGCKFWGLNSLFDPRAYLINLPFYLSSHILGPFQGIIKSDLRYDERLYLKEDYDFFLQNMNEFRKCLRFNMFNYNCDHQKMPGGAQLFRSTNEEELQNKMLQKKWGKEIIRNNSWHEDSINPIINLKL